jgi:hypothetical protein
MSAWNDLEHAGEWTVEGDWPNDPVASRQRFLDAFSRAPSGEWCTLDSLVAAVRETDWEFMRPSSSFEDWMLRNRDGDFLRGLDSWDLVEGELARSLITRPMAWFGWVDIAPAILPRAFRATGEESVEKKPEAVAGLRERKARIHNDGTILIPPNTSFILRYRLARCSEWMGRTGEIFVYRITPRSLLLAREQDIQIAHILALLKRLGGDVSSALEKSLRRWERTGVEAELRTERLLVPRTPEAAAQIAARAESLRGLLRRVEGPAWVVRPAGVRRLRDQLGLDGYLIDEEETP